MTRLFAGTPFDREPTCEVCGKPDAECICPPPEKVWLDPAKQTVRVQVEKRKKGKRVTVVGGLSPDESDLPALLTDLKSHCGCGGTLQGDQLEVQGEHVDRVRAFLSSRGYRIR